LSRKRSIRRYLLIVISPDNFQLVFNSIEFEDIASPHHLFMQTLEHDEFEAIDFATHRRMDYWQ